MRVVVVADIFGKTPVLEELCDSLEAEVTIIDPYAGDFKEFKHEMEAYSFFSKHVGLGVYSKTLKRYLLETSMVEKLVGFSVGASAIWNISAEVSMELVPQGYCFYGSQIRKLANIEPLFPIKVFFPREESHFSVPELSDALCGKVSVNLHHTRFLHGFMNRCSVNFDEVGYAEGIRWINS